MRDQVDKQILAVMVSMLEQHLAWGPVAGWTQRDFKRLSDLLADKVHDAVSVTTLKRALGRVHYQGLPQLTTLNSLSRLLGFAGWQALKQTVLSTPLGQQLAAQALNEGDAELPATSSKAFADAGPMAPNNALPVPDQILASYAAYDATGEVRGVPNWGSRPFEAKVKSSALSSASTPLGPPPTEELLATLLNAGPMVNTAPESASPSAGPIAADEPSALPSPPQASTSIPGHTAEPPVPTNRGPRGVWSVPFSTPETDPYLRTEPLEPTVNIRSTDELPDDLTLLFEPRRKSTAQPRPATPPSAVKAPAATSAPATPPTPKTAAPDYEAPVAPKATAQAPIQEVPVSPQPAPTPAPNPTLESATPKAHTSAAPSATPADDVIPSVVREFSPGNPKRLPTYIYWLAAGLAIGFVIGLVVGMNVVVP